MTPDNNYLSYIMRARRTIHAFENIKVEDSIVEAAIDCARWAPNHKLTEPWRVIIIGDETASQIVELNTRLVRDKRGEKSAAAKHSRWSAVPNWMAVTSAKSDDAVRTKEDFASTCTFIQNLMLYLWTKRVGVKWTTGAVTRYDDVYHLLNIDPAEVDLVGLLWYGYADIIPTAAPRKAVNTIVSHVP